MFCDYSDDEKEIILKWVSSSIELLIANDNELLKPDRIEVRYLIRGQKYLNREVHEITLNHRFAYYIETLMPNFGYLDYNVDTEYNRFNNQRKMVHSINTGREIEVRPDIIVQKELGLMRESLIC